jgi:hypothetical protein
MRIHGTYSCSFSCASSKSLGIYLVLILKCEFINFEVKFMLLEPGKILRFHRVVSPFA